MVAGQLVGACRQRTDGLECPHAFHHHTLVHAVPMIHVVATITVKPGQRDRFLAEFHSIVAPTLAENGCLRYQPTIDISPRIHAKQVAERPEVVTIIEAWRDIPALEAHLTAPHMAAYRERVKDMVISGALQITQDATR